jgi:metal-responsive CopG/Arc/MetJ family transcriptional regulator
MRKTIFIPDHLGARLEEYLRENPNETASSVIQEALEMRLRPKRDLSALLEIAGQFTAIEVPETDLQPEDRWVATATRQPVNQ